MKFVQSLLILCIAVFSTSAFSECRKIPSGFGGYTLQCDDGNQYRVQKNELLGTTRIEGSNPYNNSTWNQEITNNSITPPTMRGTDKNGNQYNCSMNQLTKQWQCY
jgi:hypothetical protein